MDPVAILKAFYLGSSAIVLIVFAIKPLKSRYLAYGARHETSDPAQNGNLKTSKREDSGADGWHLRVRNSLQLSLDYMATFQVPHSWFASFYMVSLCSSILWLQQLSTGGFLVRRILEYTAGTGPSMSRSSMESCWCLMFLQGSRRLYECLTLTKPSSSTMWIVHWLIGIAFYIAMGISIWIEGSPALRDHSLLSSPMEPNGPSWWTTALMAVFLIASQAQHRAHVHLASLVKYSLPTDSVFHNIVCPHYTAECVLYLALAVRAAPEGRLLNMTVFCGFVFIVVNLGVTADLSRNWAMDKFGREKVEGKWRMIPGIW